MIISMVSAKWILRRMMMNSSISISSRFMHRAHTYITQSNMATAYMSLT